ncbi:MAG: hypothetical protein M5U28_14685 [Sandaracinaceae bacterium]|nr:hypothetical protein [Sandaracinaceae bacterium]
MDRSTAVVAVGPARRAVAAAAIELAVAVRVAVRVACEAGRHAVLVVTGVVADLGVAGVAVRVVVVAVVAAGDGVVAVAVGVGHRAARVGDAA